MTLTSIVFVIVQLVVALFNALSHLHTPEKWIELAITRPRWANLIRLVRAMGCDPVKAWKSFVGILTAADLALTTKVDSNASKGNS